MKSVIIIGGGIAGLSAGIFAQKYGFESSIYEKHSISGGECTAWRRQEFVIDGCIHWLLGIRNGTSLNRLWTEVGALGDVEIYEPESFGTAECEGQTVILYRDLNKLEKHLIEISQEDKEEIEKLCEYVRTSPITEPPCDKPLDQMNIFELMKLGKSMKSIRSIMKKLGSLTITEYSNRFKSEAIRMAFQSWLPANNNAYILAFTLGNFTSRNTGIPNGGSLALAQRMEQRYTSLGGQVKLGAEISEIIVESGVAKGIRLKDGTIKYADYIVPACDISVTYKKLLNGKYNDIRFEKRYEDNNTYPLQGSIYASFAVDTDLSAYPINFAFKTSKFDFENGVSDIISIKHYCHEPSFSPKGKSVLIASLNANYTWWKEKHNNAKEYKAEKKRLANVIIERIEERFPELTGKITILDVATPLTYERYCGAYKGSWMSFGETPRGKQLMHNGKIKGIKNLYMAGQWLVPSGGLPNAVVTGKWALQRICKQEKFKPI